MSPDGDNLYVCAGNHTNPTEFAATRQPPIWTEDQLLPRLWDSNGHARGRMAPGGWIAKVSPDGSDWELISNGYRNEYDIALNADGELFTYDADMEWDVGAPWYRPTRVNHATSGSEFGWRSGTGKWPEYYPDSLGSVVDIGPGSPTGIVFGYGAKFPAKYQKALYICDWSYGVMYAIHLTPDGSSYVGEKEPFLTAAPLALTDCIVHPDGSLYFTVGGRNTESALYRVVYRGEESTNAVDTSDAEGAGLRTLRKTIEEQHHAGASVDVVWTHLGHEDRHIRYAARIALENAGPEWWVDRLNGDMTDAAKIEAATALARTSTADKQRDIAGFLLGVDYAGSDRLQRLAWLRAMSLTFARLGSPEGDVRGRVLAKINSAYPASGADENRELCQLLVYLQAPGVVERTLDLMETAQTQEDAIHYSLCLSNLRYGWTLEERERYFDWFVTASTGRGGHSFAGFLKNIRDEAVAKLTEEDQQALAEVLAKEPPPAVGDIPTEPREFVKKWTVDELVPELDAGLGGRDIENGRRLFAAATCFKCHRYNGQGGIIGPDLTGVARRFNNRDLLESLIEPSKTVSDQYQATVFQLADGRVVTGRVVNLSGDGISVLPDMLEPDTQIRISRNEVEEQFPSPTSMMPEGLLDTLTEAEILDLIAFLKSGGESTVASN